MAVGLLLVPQAMAYAQLAGLPPAMGLWCSAIAGTAALLADARYRTIDQAVGTPTVRLGLGHQPWDPPTEP